MSTATEIAKAEADEAEAAEEEEAEPDNGDTPTEPESAPPPPPPDSAKLLKRLDGEGARHEAALQKIMGEDFDTFARCPLCALSPHGYVLPLQALPEDAQNVIREGVNLYVGSPVPDAMQLREAADMVTCEVCDGWGLVRSGSKNPNHVTEVCNPCTGNGWKRRSIEAAPSYTATVMQPAPPVAQGAPFRDVNGGPSWAAPDMAGRLFGDPDYGKPSLAPVIGGV